MSRITRPSSPWAAANLAIAASASVTSPLAPRSSSVSTRTPFDDDYDDDYRQRLRQALATGAGPATKSCSTDMSNVEERQHRYLVKAARRLAQEGRL